MFLACSVALISPVFYGGAIFWKRASIMSQKIRRSVRTPFIALLVVALLVVTNVSYGQNPATRRGQFAFVHSMAPAASGAFTLAVDYAEIFSGNAAERAARDAGESAAADGRYIENRTRVLRTLTVPAYAQVYLLQGGQPTLVRPAVLYSLLRGEKSPFGAFDGFPFNCGGEESDCLPVRIIQRGGRVLRIEQEPLP